MAYLLITLLTLFTGSLMIQPAACAPQAHRLAAVEPSLIDVWYGPSQTFGGNGLAQQWINILGNVAPGAALSYSLNGGEKRPLRLGPDERRLLAAGDFNVELDHKTLRIGENCLLLTATTEAGLVEETAVVINYQPNRQPLPYAIDWAEVDQLTAVAQPVDGLWAWSEAGVRPAPSQIGYDRVLAIGDMGWHDYEVLLPITIHGLDESAYDSPISVAPGLGVLLHWAGHTDDPVRCGYIHCGWKPKGASAWFAFDRNQIELAATPPDGKEAVSEPPLRVGATYWLRLRTEKTAVGNRYHLKVWLDGQPEPDAWMLQKLTHAINFAQGSVLLVAHHVDATFGNLQVVALSTMPKTFMLGNYLAQLPLFLLSLALFFHSWRWRERDYTLALLLLLANLLLLIVALADGYFDMNLPVLLNQLRWEEERIKLAVIATTMLQSLLLVGSFFLLALAFRRWQKTAV